MKLSRYVIVDLFDRDNPVLMNMGTPDEECYIVEAEQPKEFEKLIKESYLDAQAPTLVRIKTVAEEIRIINTLVNLKESILEFKKYLEDGNQIYPDDMDWLAENVDAIHELVYGFKIDEWKDIEEVETIIL